MAASGLVVGAALAVFVGVDIGGSSTAAAFGPSVGNGMVTTALAAALVSLFVLAGGWTVGAIAGLGLAAGTLRTGAVATIAAWWVVSPAPSALATFSVSGP